MFSLRPPELRPYERSRVAEDLDAWLNGIKLRFRLGRVDDEINKLGYAGLYLTGRALNWYISQSFGTFTDFENGIKDTFYNKFPV